MEHPNMPRKIADRAIVKLNGKQVSIASLWELANGQNSFTIDGLRLIVRSVEIVKILQ